MSAGQICNRTVVTAVPTETARVAAQRMAKHGVGTLVILDPEAANHPVGLVTDRDLALKCVAGILNPDDTPVADLMSTPLQVVDAAAPVEDTVRKMAAAGMRRMVVTDTDGRLVGILSVDDIVDHLVEEADAIAQVFQKQRAFQNA